MKTKRNTSSGLGALLACSILVMAVSTPAKKPVKPPKPPPEPSGPAYQIISLDGANLYPEVISDTGILAGLTINPDLPADLIAGFTLAPQMDGEVIDYLAGDIQLLAFDDGDDTWSEAYPLDMNEAGIAVGWAWGGYGAPGHAILIEDSTIYELAVKPKDVNNSGWLCGSGFVGIPEP